MTEKSFEEEAYGEIADLVIETLNPPDEDASENYIIRKAIEKIVEYVDAIKCSCPPDIDWIGDACGRCQALGRMKDKAVDR